MKFQAFSCGQTWIDGIEYGHDVMIERGEVRERKKKASKKLREPSDTHPYPWREG